MEQDNTVIFNSKITTVVFSAICGLAGLYLLNQDAVISAHEEMIRLFRNLCWSEYNLINELQRTSVRSIAKNPSALAVVLHPSTKNQ